MFDFRVKSQQHNKQAMNFLHAEYFKGEFQNLLSSLMNSRLKILCYLSMWHHAQCAWMAHTWDCFIYILDSSNSSSITF